MNKLFVLAGLTCMFGFLSAQNFNGQLIYYCESSFHTGINKTIKYQDSNSKSKDSIVIVLNDSTLRDYAEQKGTIPDSIGIVFGDYIFKKTYYSRDTTEYIFYLKNSLKVSHTPHDHCIDSSEIRVTPNQGAFSIEASDSNFNVNGYICKRLILSKEKHDLFVIYYTPSEYQNLADAFIYELHNNLFYPDLYFVKNYLEESLIVEINYHPNKSFNARYSLAHSTSFNVTSKNFELPKYEYCLWDIFVSKKVKRMHRKHLKQEKKALKNGR